MTRYVGRLAPSPTGALHLGNVRTFMIAWLRARSQGGKVIFRMEDLDHPKDKPGAAAQAVEDLRWLGFDWDEEYVQSERIDCYRQALDVLRASCLVYPCVCSRRDVEAAQSAPHAGEQLYYPGTCRGRFATWREAVDFKMASFGTQSNNRTIPDFPVGDSGSLKTPLSPLTMPLRGIASRTCRRSSATFRWRGTSSARGIRSPARWTIS